MALLTRTSSVRGWAGYQSQAQAPFASGKLHSGLAAPLLAAEGVFVPEVGGPNAAPLARTGSVGSVGSWAAYRVQARAQPEAARQCCGPAAPRLAEEDPEVDDDLPRAQTAPTGRQPLPEPSDPFDRAMSEPGTVPQRRYVAYRANPFRADLCGGGTAVLPRGTRARLEEKLGSRAGLALCSATRKEEVLSEAEFHDVMEQVQEEVEKAEGPIDSYSDTLVALISALVTNPLIVMPYYMSLNGLLVGPLLVCFVGAVALRCAGSLHFCVDELARRVPTSESPPLARDYAFVAHHAFGRTMAPVASALYTLDYGSAVVANFVAVDSLYRDWLPTLPAEWRFMPLLGHAAVTCALLYVPSTIFGRTQHLSALNNFVLLAVLATLALPKLAGGGADVQALPRGGATADDIFLQIASMIYAFGNTAILPKITSSWQGRPCLRRSLLRASYAGSAGVYVAFGVVGAVALGRCGPDAVFAMKGPLGLASQASFLVKVQFVLPLISSPCAHVVQDVLGLAQRKRQRMLCTLALVFASAVLARAAGGQIDTVMSLIGACVTTSLVLVLPPLMELSLCWAGLAPRQRARLLALAGMGAAFALGGTMASWRRLRGA